MSSSSLISMEKPSKSQDVIGFYHVPDQIQRKVIRKGFDFTMLIAGESGLGKSTFVNTMFIQDLYKDRSVPLASDLIKRTVQIEKRSVEIEEFGIKLRLTVVDTPGFGDTLNNANSWKFIKDYIEMQYESYFQAESSINRKNITDNRVHCCIYFISPNGYGLHKIDIEFMKHLQDLVNIIPVIAKADTLTACELQRLKEKVKRDIAANQILVYDFSLHQADPDDNDETAKRWNRELQDLMPFAVIGGNTTIEVNGQKMRARAYPWGIIEIDNTRHCDFSSMREMLVSTHMQDLKDRTVDIHYENYRARRLLSPSNTVPNLKPVTVVNQKDVNEAAKSAANKIAVSMPSQSTQQYPKGGQPIKSDDSSTHRGSFQQSQKAQSKSTIYKIP